MAAWLRRGGVRRVVVGHKPSGDSPAVLRAVGDGLEVGLLEAVQEHVGAADDARGVRAPQHHADLAEERARPEMTERTAAALDQLEIWVRSLCVSG